ncbi:hypothetical protein pb186bvf_020269 [Paramecium bursaria]
MNAVNTLKNGGLVDSIYESFREYFTEKKFMQRSIICQIYQIKTGPSKSEILEIILSNSQQLVKAKMYRSILSKCARKINENIEKEIMILRGSFVSITEIQFEPIAKTTDIYDVYINDFFYIENMNGPIINAHILDKQKPIQIAPFSEYDPFKKLLMAPKSLVYAAYHKTKSHEFQIILNQFIDDLQFKPGYRQDKRTEDTETRIIQKSL